MQIIQPKLGQYHGFRFPAPWVTRPSKYMILTTQYQYISVMNVCGCVRMIFQRGEFIYIHIHVSLKHFSSQCINLINKGTTLCNLLSLAVPGSFARRQHIIIFHHTKRPVSTWTPVPKYWDSYNDDKKFVRMSHLYNTNFYMVRQPLCIEKASGGSVIADVISAWPARKWTQIQLGLYTFRMMGK